MENVEKRGRGRPVKSNLQDVERWADAKDAVNYYSDVPISPSAPAPSPAKTMEVVVDGKPAVEAVGPKLLLNGELTSLVAINTSCVQSGKLEFVFSDGRKAVIIGIIK